MAKPRVLLADSQVPVLGAFEKLLEAECDIVGQVSDGVTLVTEAARLEPDVIVLDVAMPLLNGLESARQIRQILAKVKLVFVTANEAPHLAADAFRTGASAYLLKRSVASELIIAIREVMLERWYVTPAVTAAMIGALLNGDARSSCGLTDRQREVLQLIAAGNTMREVGALLNLTPRTVAFHKSRMKRQLHVKSTAALIEYAVKHHIV
jgi:DNA-binding NarL/FixJ family response regulator